MSSSDNIKDALAAAYPATSEKDWKRRSKTKVAGGVERVFDNKATGQIVVTIELPDGNVNIDGVTYKSGAKKAPVTAPVAPSVAPAVSAAPAAPKAAPAAPVAASGTKIERNQMVPGSKWVFDRDVTVTTWETTPAFDKMFHDRSIDYNLREATAEAMGKAGTAYAERVVAVIPKGTTFEVAGKFSTSANGWSGKKSYETNSGLMVPVEPIPGISGLVTVYVASASSGAFSKPALPFAQIRENITALEIPETLVYVLRDTATGELFGGWKNEKYSENMGGGRVYNGTRSDVGNPKMVTKLSSAKKYATSSACKASIREFTGYNVGLEEGDEGGAYYIMGGQKAMDLPPTWEMVEFDKVTGVEKRVIDVQNWLVGLNRLRVLTTTHGSAARAAFKKAEASKDDFAAIIVFQNRSVGVSSYNGKPWDEKARFDDWRYGRQAQAAIVEAAERISGKKLKATSASAIAYAVQSVSDAIFAKMAFDFDAEDDQAIGITLLDFNTLEEIVEAQA